MRDGSAAVLFASCSTPAIALDGARQTWLGRGDEPIEIREYRGGNTKPIGRPTCRPMRARLGRILPLALIAGWCWLDHNWGHVRRHPHPLANRIR
jgi:hypothetical protein